MWIKSNDKNFLANINQAKYALLDGKFIKIYFDEDKYFESEFDSEEEAKKNFDKFAEFWAATTWETFMENF